MDCFGLLFISICFLLIISLFLFKIDILSPSIDICTMYFISACFALAYRNIWRVAYNFPSCFITIVGLSTIVYAEYLTKGRGKYRDVKKIKRNVENEWKKLDVNYYIYFVIDILTIISSYLYYKEIVRISRYAGNFSSSVIVNFRQIYTYSGAIEYDQLIKTEVSQLVKIPNAAAYISIFIIAYNLLGEKRKMRIYQWIMLLIPMVAFCFNAFLSGGRFGFIRYFSAIIVIIYIVSNSKSGWREKAYRKYIYRIILFAMMFTGAFYWITPLIRKSNSRSFLNYIAIYCGAPLALFSKYFDNPPNNNVFFMQETLCKLYQSLYKLRISNQYVSSACEYRTSIDGSLGNVYGFFRRFYQDAGFVGVVLFTFIFIFIVSRIYYKFLRNTSSSNFKWKILLVYSYFYHIIVIAASDNCVRVFFQLGEWISIGILLILYWLIFQAKFKIRNINLPK